MQYERFRKITLVVLIQVLVKLYESLLLSLSLSVKEMRTEILQTNSLEYQYVPVTLHFMVKKVAISPGEGH